ncbi:MAG TPA: hypothetical protein VJS44_21825 [Pyrinomonadaceae bacterium]|nr:hypothetical protein [Pyrinomonadaceae bacterium]
MKRGFIYLLLAVAFLSLQLSAHAQEKTGTPSSATQTERADDYAYRLTFFVVQKLERSTDNRLGDPLSQAANELFAADKQEQIRRDLDRRIGRPGSRNRDTKYDALLEKVDRKLSDKTIRELREDLAKKQRGGIGKWPWPLCAIVGCR